MSFPRYPRYKDSGVEWLGRVPQHWDVGPIKRHIRKVDSGTSVNAFDQPAEEGEVGVLKTSCVYTERFDPNENKTVVKEDLDRVTCPLRIGTLIVSRMNTPDLIGAAGLVTEARANLYLPDRLWQISFSDTDARFVHFWTQTSLYRAQVQSVCTGTSSSMKNLGQDQFGMFTLATPPLQEQTHIAAFLDRETERIDELVTEQRRLMELLKEKRQAVISHAVTKGLNPDAPMKPSGVDWLGTIPAEWEIRRLSNVCEFRPGKAHEPFIDDEGEFVCVNSRFVSTEGRVRKYCSKNLTPAQKNDILMVMSDLPNGRALAKAYFVQDNDPYAVNQRVCALTSRKDHPKFLSYLLDRNRFFLQYDDGINQTHLPNSAFEKFQTPIPPLTQQVAIAAFLDRETFLLDKLTSETQRAIDLLQERRTALISAAVTGQIDVRSADQVEAA